jgi:uncharacterized protein
MFKSLLFVVTLTSLCCISSAQSQPSAVHLPSSVQAVPSPGNASRESVLRLLEIRQTKRNMQVMRESMATAGKQGARQGFLKEVPDASEKQLKLVDSIWDDIFKEFNIDDLMELVVTVYQHHLSQADVNGLIAFYESPLGQKFLAEQPAMMQESIKASSEYAQSKMEPMMKRMDEKMKALMDTKPQANSAAPKQP